MKRRGNAPKTTAVALTLLLLIVNMASVFALGPPGPTFFINVSQFAQKVTAGESATYDVDLIAFAGQFNVTVGLAERRRADWQQLSPLPAGVEAVYPKQINIKAGSESYRFPVVVKTSPDMKESTVDVEILVVGRYDGGPIGVLANIRLYVVPRITSLGAASTVFYEGFDKWNERGGSWTVNSKGGSVEMYALNDPGIDYPGTIGPGWSMGIPYASLRMTKNFLDYTVGAERPIPRLNGSFILEFAMRPDEKRINFTFDLTDTLQNTGIHTELSEGNLAVQGRSYGTYNTAQWYKFRFEHNATNRTIQWYLNSKYMDSLPFTGAPDRIKTEISGSGVGTGYIDDIFLQKIEDGQPTSTTVISNNTASTTSWLSGWNYRKSHTINSAPDAGNNYQIEITVHRENGADYGKDVYLNYRSLNWPNDIRFTGKDGITELNYWLEDSSANTATFWVKVKDDLSYSGTTIYIYYGKSDASSASNGENTFEFFDDFSETNLDTSRWIETRGSASISNSILTLSDGARIDSKLNFGLHYAAYFKAQYTNWDFYAGQVSTGFRAELGDNDSNSVYIYAYSEPNFFTFVTRKDGQPSWNTMNELEDFNWHTFKYFRASSTSAKGQLDNGKIYETTEHVPTIPLPLTIETRSYYAGTLKTDWVFVRKYVPQEPSQGSWSGEQQNSSGAITEQVRISPLDWSYKKSHVINAAAGAGTNYPVKIVVHKGTGTDAGSDVYLNNHALNWPNDIRFVGSDMVTQLDYWMEISNGSTATFWVKLKDNISVASTTLYLYYGNSSAAAASSLANTFIDADDFEGDTVGQAPSGWITGDTVVTVQSDSAYVQQGSKGLEVVSNGHSTPSYRKITPINSDNSRAIEFWGKVITEDYNYYQYFEIMDDSGNVLILLSFRNIASSIQYYDGSGNNNGWVTLQPYAVDTWYHFKIYNIDFTNQQFDVDIDGVNRLVNGHFYTNGVSLNKFGIGGGDGTTQKDAFDIFLTRKYVSTEPSQGSWGSEEATSEVTSHPSGPFAGWGFKKSHVINSAMNAGSNYQVRIVVHKGAGTDSGENVYLNDHALNWPNDIQFTSSDGITELNYWLELFDNDTAIFWVKVKDDLSARSATIYVYYGKPDALSISNGATTFAFFDDFNGSSLDTKWSMVPGSSYTVSNNILQITSGAVGLQNPLGFNINDGYLVESRIRYDNIESGKYSGTLETSSSQFTADSNYNGDATILYMVDAPSGSTSVHNWVGSGSSYSYDVVVGATAFTMSPGAWYVLGNGATSSTASVWKDYTRINSYQVTWSKNMQYVALGAWYGNGAYDLKDTSYDWIRIRKYVSLEPSQGSWGDEQPANSATPIQSTASGLSDWGYRKSHTINAAANAGSNYQIRIIVHRGAGNDSGENVYLNSHSLNWPNDIRLTGSDGATELNYWLERYDDSTAIFWVKLNDDLSSKSSITYLYYGKSNAISTSNGDATFIFFDDFPGDSLNQAKWQIYTAGNGGSIDVSNGILRMKSNGGDSDWISIRTASTFSVPYVWKARLNFTDYTSQLAGLYRESDTNPSEYGTSKFATPYGNKVSQETDYVSYHQQQQTFNFNQFYDFEIRRDASGYNDFYIDDSIVQNDHIYAYSEPTRLMLGSYYLASRTFEADWVFIRKYTAPEPNQGSWGREEPASAISYPSGKLLGFDHRKLHAINPAAGAGADYQIKLIVHKGSGTDSGADVYLNNHALSWPNDIMFTGGDGVTQLSYWLESSDSNSAIFWVKVKDDLSARDATIYIYYGRPSALSASNGGETFEFFDDFSNSTLDISKWSVQDASTSLSNGILTVTNPSTTFSGIRSANSIDLSNWRSVEARVKWDTVSGTNHFSFGLFDTAGPTIWWNRYSTHYYAYPDNPDNNVYVYVCDGDCDARATIVGGYDNNWHQLKITARVAYEPTLWWDGSPYHIDRNLAGTTFYLWPAKAYDELDKQIQIDWVFIRKLAPAEPSQGSWGSEEKLSEQPAITTSVTSTKTVMKTTTVASTQISTSTVTQSTTVTNIVTAKSAEQATEPLTSAWAIGATIVTLALAEVLLLKRTRGKR